MWWNLNLEGLSEESLVQVKIPTRNVPNGTESVTDDDDLLILVIGFLHACIFMDVCMHAILRGCTLLVMDKYS